MSNIDFSTRTLLPVPISSKSAKSAVAITLPKNRMEAADLAKESVKDPLVMQQLLTDLLIKSEKL